MRGLRLGLGLNVTPRGTPTPSAPVMPFQGDMLGWWEVQDGDPVYSDAGTTPAAVSGTVQQINDKSGNGKHITQAVSGSRFTLHEINGLRSLYGNNGPFMDVPDLAANTRACTVFVVYSTFSNVSQGVLAIGSAAATPGMGHFLQAATGSHELRHIDSGGAKTSGLEGSHGLNAACWEHNASNCVFTLGKESFNGTVAPAGTTGGTGQFGAHFAAANKVRGRMVAAFVFGRTMSAAEKDRVFQEYIELVYPVTKRTADIYIGFEGDSLTEGVGTSNFLTNVNKDYGHPAQMHRLSDGAFKYQIDSNGGDKIESMLANWPTSGLRTQLLANASYGVRRIELWAGTNDCNTATRVDTVTPQSAAAIISDLQGMVSAIKTADAACQVYGSTILDRGDFSADERTMRNTVNAAIRDGTIAFDHYHDLAALPELSDFTNLTYFDPDQVHLKDAAQLLIAQTKLANYVTWGLL